MKKGLLTAMGLSAALFASAQQFIKPGSATEPGVAVNDFSNTNKKDFSTPDGKYGMYFWKDTVNLAFPYITALLPDGTFDAKQEYTDGVCRVTPTRNVGSIDYVVSQPIGVYQPLGFGFGTIKTSPTDSTKQVINLSARPDLLKVAINFSFDMTALATTTKGYKVKVSLEDIDGKLIDSQGPNGGTRDQYMDELYVTVGTDGSFLASSDFIDADATAGVGYMVFDFTGSAAYGSKYSLISTTACPAPLAPVTGFNASKVVGVQITVVSQAQYDDADCYNKLKLTDAKFSITKVVVGDIIQGVENEQLFASKGFVAYPSPVEGGDVNFSATAENVKVYDVVGNMVFSAASASKVNVDSFSKGLYIVKSSKGSTRFVVK